MVVSVRAAFASHYVYISYQAEQMKKDLRDYLNRIEREVKREDCFRLVEIMEEESGYKAMLNGKIVGFGIYHYVYDSGREGDAIVTGFAPRSQDIAIYIMPGFSKYKQELDAIGKHKSAKCCLYIKKLADINEKVLRRIIRDSVKVMKDKYECRNA